MPLGTRGKLLSALKVPALIFKHSVSTASEYLTATFIFGEASMRSYLLAILLSSLFTVFAMAEHAMAEQTASRPNVLLIFVDDLRTSLGCYGDPLVKSPNIDRLAATSRVFKRAYCHQAVCGPSRASILTGRLPDHTGVWHNRHTFRTTLPDLVTLPQLFKNNGYHAQGLGKIFSGDAREEDPLSWTIPTVLRASGWKNYALPVNNQREGKGVSFEMADVPDDGYPDGKLAELAIDTLQTWKVASQPFFLAVGFFKPHLPFNAPKKYWDWYDPEIFDLKASRSRTHGAPAVAYPDHLELAGYKDMPKDERLSLEQARQMRHGYYACVSYIDAQVGKVLDALRRLELDTNTIVVLLGDHGYSLGEADHWCKDTNFELDTRVPLLIRSPGLQQPGVATESLVEYVDLYPTLAALAKLASPKELDGQSIEPILKDPLAEVHEHVLSQFSRPFAAGNPEVMGYSIRTNQYRYTRWIDWNAKELQAEELYDYASDKSVDLEATFQIERNNVIDVPEYAALREQLRLRLDELLKTRVKPVLLKVDSKKTKKIKKQEQR
jgi:iduronate 2-sulfatase